MSILVRILSNLFIYYVTFNLIITTNLCNWKIPGIIWSAPRHATPAEQRGAEQRSASGELRTVLFRLFRGFFFNQTTVEEETKKTFLQSTDDNHGQLQKRRMSTPLSRLDEEMARPTIPRLNILLLTVGTRGDVQPFLALAHALSNEGHRCRLATHAAFQEWVVSNSADRFEFYPLAGDPTELASYMTKMEGRVFPKDLTELQDMLNALPSNQSMLRNILSSTLPAATSSVKHEDPTTTTSSNKTSCGRPPFLAEAIVANPVAFGAIHIAQGLGIPLHMMFPQPWCATKRWPHPLALHPLFDIDYATCSANPRWNEATYGVVNKFLWHAQSAAMNEFRTSSLGLPPITLGQRNNLLRDHEVPFSFIWSKCLMDKPSDWGPHIRVVGSVFENQVNASADDVEEQHCMSDLQESERLIQFLEEGLPPIFVGFGSCEPAEEDLLRLVHVVVTATMLTWKSKDDDDASKEDANKGDASKEEDASKKEEVAGGARRVPTGNAILG